MTQTQQPNPEQETDLTWAGNMIRQAQETNFFGKIVIVMHEGIIQHVVQERHVRPPRRRKVIHKG